MPPLLYVGCSVLGAGEGRAVGKNRHWAPGTQSAKETPGPRRGGAASPRSNACSEICRLSRRQLGKEEEHRQMKQRV